MHRLIYVSRSLVPGRPDVLAEIVGRSAARNAAAGVTGILWCDGEFFVQALEGSVDAISATYGRISLDKRHTGIDVVVSREIAKPVFGGWSMIQADNSSGFDDYGTFLIGLAAEKNSPANGRMRDVILASFE